MEGRKNQTGHGFTKDRFYVISLNIIGKKMMQTDKSKKHQKNRKSIFDINIVDQNNKTTKISNRRFKK
jgi:hypothetical protein